MKESEKELANYLSNHNYPVECVDDLEVYTDLLKRYSKEAIEAYLDFVSAELGIFEDSYVGKYSSKEHFAHNVIVSCINPRIREYFTTDEIVAKLFAKDYVFVNGYVFLKP